MTTDITSRAKTKTSADGTKAFQVMSPEQFKFDGMKIERLTIKTDFVNWSTRFLLIARLKGFKQYFLDKDTVEESKTDSDLEKIKDYALTYLAMSVDDSIMQVIRVPLGKGNPYAVWQTLRGHFLGSQAYNLLSWRQEFFNLRMKDSTTLIEFIDNINRLCEQLASAGKDMDDEDKLAVFVSGLHRDQVNILNSTTGLT